MLSAGLRAMLVALLISIPALLLPEVSDDATQIVALLALVAALFTFVEYSSVYPSLIEFRSAPPFNRLRFGMFFVTVLSISMICRGAVAESAFATVVSAIGQTAGAALDFPFSPVRLMLLVAEDAPTHVLFTLRASAGLALCVGLLSLAIFVLQVRLQGWPLRRGAFNFWVNLPMFEPTTGGDVIYRLKRDATINIVLGSLLPFLIPAVLKLMSLYILPISFAAQHPMIWMVAAWALIPTSMVMRGVALLRIADLVEEKRRRAYAAAQAEDGFQAA